MTGPFLNTERKRRCITSPGTLEKHYVNVTRYRLKKEITRGVDDLLFIIENDPDSGLKSHISAQLARITGIEMEQPVQESTKSFEDQMWSGTGVTEEE